MSQKIASASKVVIAVEKFIAKVNVTAIMALPAVTTYVDAVQVYTMLFGCHKR
jgi:hypothetical protein